MGRREYITLTRWSYVSGPGSGPSSGSGSGTGRRCGLGWASGWGTGGWGREDFPALIMSSAS